MVPARLLLAPLMLLNLSRRTNHMSGLLRAGRLTVSGASHVCSGSCSACKHLIEVTSTSGAGGARGHRQSKEVPEGV